MIFRLFLSFPVGEFNSFLGFTGIGPVCFQRLLNVDSCIKMAQRFRHPWDVSQCSGRWYCLASSGQGVKA